MDTVHQDLLSSSAAAVGDPVEPGTSRQQGIRLFGDKADPFALAKLLGLGMPEDLPSISFWRTVLTSMLGDNTANELIDAVRQSKEKSLSKTKRETTESQLRQAAEDVRSAVLINTRLGTWELAEGRGCTQEIIRLQLRHLLWSRLSTLVWGCLGAGCVTYSPEIIPFAVQSLSTIPISRLPATASLTGRVQPGGSDAGPHSSLTSGGGVPTIFVPSGQGTGPGGNYAPPSNDSRDRPPAQQRSKKCRWCDDLCTNFGQPRALPFPHLTHECTCDLIPIPCKKPVCFAQNLHHKTGGPTCREEHAKYAEREAARHAGLVSGGRAATVPIVSQAASSHSAAADLSTLLANVLRGAAAMQSV
uniref:Uncharacterized protein n=1 Tax=Chromera velia CCMP2878 TaxID=1169474 RepID=A0A0G4G034_9ALVE|mmetsp:Transcript_12251/g.23736  ORF Transcript_12251/g.23736 Transcript_12251/m.23736 type:complete len:360 (+) Transcript_12251:1135-2214(+)|eukprot:Cvel_523.t1-p1 / transcript=Cvel_523.t1 / gene=Cvel_523 / organism=Chromera_velia_CCMP2878 / gene_product=hypothetical protein / transcript_product=hypothetical protein / location=Cvel_scaffold16:107812-108888(-) / protein_length=359 / sequence_SO=supercontig / SO=protein_coding / is_pseudo=false